MRVLITGAAGAIGREITAELDTDHELYLVDKIPLGAVWIMLFIKVARTACRVPYLTHIIGSFGKASMMIMCCISTYKWNYSIQFSHFGTTPGCE